MDELVVYRWSADLAELMVVVHDVQEFAGVVYTRYRSLALPCTW